MILLLKGRSGQPASAVHIVGRGRLEIRGRREQVGVRSNRAGEDGCVGNVVRRRDELRPGDARRLEWKTVAFGTRRRRELRGGTFGGSRNRRAGRAGFARARSSRPKR